MNRSNLSRLFYVYSELSLAVLMLGGAIIESICGLYLYFRGVNSLAYLAFGAVVFLSLVAISSVRKVYSLEKKFNSFNLKG
jgi:hypothetical protein